MHDDILDAQFVSKWYMPEDIDYEKLETRFVFARPSKYASA